MFEVVKERPHPSNGHLNGFSPDREKDKMSGKEIERRKERDMGEEHVQPLNGHFNSVPSNKRREGNKEGEKVRGSIRGLH